MIGDIEAVLDGKMLLSLMIVKQKAINPNPFSSTTDKRYYTTQMANKPA